VGGEGKEGKRKRGQRWMSDREGGGEEAGWLRLGWAAGLLEGKGKGKVVEAVSSAGNHGGVCKGCRPAIAYLGSNVVSPASQTRALLSKKERNTDPKQKKGTQHASAHRQQTLA
jgi:hypothetical protein